MTCTDMLRRLMFVFSGRLRQCVVLFRAKHINALFSSLKMFGIGKMISLVYERKPLWNVPNKNCQNRDVARKLRLEIAEELKSTSK